MTSNDKFAANRSSQIAGVSTLIPVKHSTRGEQYKPVCNGSYLHWAVWEGEELQLTAV